MSDLVKYDAARNWISLTLPENISKEEWLDVGRALSRIDRCTKWNVGEWLRLGNRKWGEMYEEAVKLGFSYQSARDAVWLAGEFPLSRRRDKLTWSHHRNVASLDATDADRLLDDAIKNGWSEKDLRRQVSNFRNKCTLPPSPPPPKPKASKQRKPLFDLDEVESESKTEPEAKHNELETSPKNRDVISPKIPLTSQETQSENITPSQGSHESQSTGESTGEPKAPKTEEVPSLSLSDSQPDIKFLRRQLDENFSRIKELEKDKEKLEKENADLNTKYNNQEIMAIGLRADLNRAEATVESLRVQLKEAEQTNEELFEAKKTIYDLKEKVVSLQNENAESKQKARGRQDGWTRIN